MAAAMSATTMPATTGAMSASVPGPVTATVAGAMSRGPVDVDVPIHVDIPIDVDVAVVPAVPACGAAPADPATPRVAAPVPAWAAPS
jgi:hypothetical protein